MYTNGLDSILNFKVARFLYDLWLQHFILNSKIWTGKLRAFWTGKKRMRGWRRDWRLISTYFRRISLLCFRIAGEDFRFYGYDSATLYSESWRRHLTLCLVSISQEYTCSRGRTLVFVAEVQISWKMQAGLVIGVFLGLISSKMWQKDQVFTLNGKLVLPCSPLPQTQKWI